jgi:hypothetical protein
MLFAFKTYEMPDGGSYQLEDLVGKEPVFLTDFDDDDAKKWISWAYPKRFMEGGDVLVVGPKNCGRNVLVKNDAPVFLTAPQEVALWRGKRVDEFETGQMRFRITDLRLHYAYLGAERKEVEPCGHCGARLYLEGCLEDIAHYNDAPSEQRGSAVAVIQTMKDLERLTNGGVIDTPELKKLKHNALENLK